MPAASAAPVFESVDAPNIADASEPFDIVVNISSTDPIYEVQLSYMNSRDGEFYYELMAIVEGNATSGVWSFTVPPQTYECTIQYRIVARDSGNSTWYPASGYSSIDVEGENPAKPFPWNLAILVVFLIVVFILTELIFKPGIYRPTGRQRARALEEEDRIREMEGTRKEED